MWVFWIGKQVVYCIVVANVVKCVAEEGLGFLYCNTQIICVGKLVFSCAPVVQSCSFSSTK